MNQLASVHLECVSLLKENIQEIETEKEDITEFKNDFLDEFNKLKLNSFTKLNHLKIIFLILHKKIQETRNI